ncbi:MAG TPA: histidine kinase dimerization/phospho-acceptor domain-containing protein, partial [Bacteroidales bacterium]|nr:histidine kinase dimerization/phospho-acceptor domain-containing protein [Bacteroidales bacterium]
MAGQMGLDKNALLNLEMVIDALHISLLTLAGIRLLAMIVFIHLFSQKREKKYILLAAGWFIMAAGSIWALYTYVVSGVMDHYFSSLLAGMGTFWVICGALLYFNVIRWRHIYTGSIIIFLYGFLPLLGLPLGPSPGVLVQLLISLLLTFIAIFRRKIFINVAKSSYFWLVLLAVFADILTLGLLFSLVQNMAIGFAVTSIIILVAIVFFLHLEYNLSARAQQLSEEKVKKLDSSKKAMLYMVEDLNNLTIELKKEQHKLLLSNKELEAFSYSVSHDLRAPLRHINGFVDMLNEKFYNDLPEKAKYYLTNITDASKQMGTLIDELLRFSRTGRQELQTVKVDMNALVKEVLERVKQDFGEREIIIKAEELPQVSGDYSMLKQVWTNLLDNAVKYTRDTQKTEISVGFKEEGGNFVFYIRDNGVGFNMKYIDKLFGVFQRLHS